MRTRVSLGTRETGEGGEWEILQGQAFQVLSGAGVWDRKEAGTQVGCSACKDGTFQQK